MVATLFLCATLAVVVSALIIWTLADGTMGFFTTPNPREDGSESSTSLVEFLTGDKWLPSGRSPKFGTLPLLAGTLLIAGGALLIAAPLGIGGAVFLSEFAPTRIRNLIKPIIEILAGIPSIVYGYFALVTISPFLREHYGASYFNAASAILVVSVMILPIILTISDDALNAVPKHLREASLALGGTRWETSTRVVLPSAASGILASVLLALARAVGETMAVALAAGQVASMSLNPLEQTQTMTSYIAMVATGDLPPGVAVDAGFAVGLYLFIITYLINLTAWRIISNLSSPTSRRGLVARKFGILFLPVGYLWSRLSRLINSGSLASRYRVERVGKAVLALSLIYSLAFLVFLIQSVMAQGLQHIDYGFLTGYPSRFPSRAGIWPALVGSLLLMLLTMVFVVPAGVGAAVYLVEFAADRWHTRLLRRVIQNLAGVPSIIFGLVGLMVFSRMFGFGPSLLTGSLTLALMTLPVVVATTEEALKNIPQGFREASLAVGATRWQTVWNHVLPNAVPGIATGTILSLSRAIGETAPILFVAGVFSKSTPSGILDGFLALPMTIFFWTRQPKDEFREMAASTILVLLVLLLAMNAVAVWIRLRAERKRAW